MKISPSRSKPLSSYDHTKIEGKWQKIWDKKKLYRAVEDPKMKKFFGLIEFPYPSGDGLHVGHIRSNTAMDIIARKRRREGYSVLYPIGWDAFGLPTENYAIKTGIQPAIVTKKNTDIFRRQLKSLGFSFDWSREIDTTDPKYYKWTQWIFLQFLKRGLAYKKKMTINWCPKDLIGLANEEVINGCCERCGTPVEKRDKEQWMLAITQYAGKLLAGLDARVTESGTLVEDDGGTPLFTQLTESSAFRPELPFVERQAVMVIVKHWSEDKYIGLKWKKVAWKTLITGGPEGSQTTEEAAITEIIEETGFRNPHLVRHLGKIDAKFFHVPKNINRYAHFDVMYFELKNGDRNEISIEEQGNHEIVWLSKDEMTSFLTPDSQRFAWAQFLNPDVMIESFSKPFLNWRESIKESQRNWIGKSEGAEVKFTIHNSKFKSEVAVFTTRPDTLYGVTYVVLAPEHELVTQFMDKIENKSEVEVYIAKVKKETDIERTDAKKEKTGIELKGVKAINPVNKEEVPVWIADYVLADYGTGAVMAVPAHDERDHAFAKKYNLPIREVIEPLIVEKNAVDAVRPELPFKERNAIVAVIKHWSEDKYLGLRWKKNGWQGFVVGGIENGEDAKTAGLREITEETGYQNVEYVRDLGGIVHSQFYHMVKEENRFGHFKPMLFKLKDGERVEISDEEKALHELVWLTPDEFDHFVNKDDLRIMWGRMRGVECYTGDGILTNSGDHSGKDSAQSRKSITEFVGGRWITTFKLRDWVFSRQRYWGEPIPVVHCDACGIVPIPEKDLPVKLPKVANYKPTETGESPLAAISKWVNTKCPKCKGKAKRETDTMPNWAGSSWYYLRYADSDNSKAFADPKKLKYWTPVDWYNGGMEHTTLHLLYSRFWHKFLYDLGLVPTSEPYVKRTSHGLILAAGGEKMSKSKGNVINPDGIVEAVGADSLRLYEMFMGPFDQPISWNTDNIAGVRRFIERVWKLRERVDANNGDATSLSTVTHKTIMKVSEDIESMRFNTAISSLMIALNEFEKGGVTQADYEVFLRLLAPFAPHVTEELWSSLGHKDSVHLSPWPTYNPVLVVDDHVTIMVQVSGKIRSSFVAPLNTTREELERLARELSEVRKWTEGKTVTRVIVVPNKLVNIVV